MSEKCAPARCVALVPVVPRDLARYTRGDQHVDTHVFHIWPLMYSDPTEPLDRTRRMGWDRHVHPEGNPYYHNQRLQIVTSCDIVDDEVNDCVKTAVAELTTRMRCYLQPKGVQSDIELLDDEWHYGKEEWELSLEISVKDAQCRYYIADWKTRTIFWVEEDPDKAAQPLSTASLNIDHWPSYNVLRSVLEHQFWKHVEYFPGHRALPAGTLDDLKAVLLYGISDRMTSVDSTISTTGRDMHKFLKMLTSNQWDTSAGNGAVVSAIARQWYNIFTDRTHNLHGEHSARLSRDQSRFYEPLERAPLGFTVRTLSCVLLFNKPRSFYRKFCKIWVDRSVYTDQWRDLMEDLQQEWMNVLKLSTIMLIANMGFLLVEHLASPYATFSIAARTLGVTSTTFTLGSIVSALLLSHQHRAYSDAKFTCKDASVYMDTCHGRVFGLFGTAMVLSIPFGLAIWSLVLFVAGLVLYSLAEFSHLWSPFILAALGIVVLLVAHQGVYFSRIKPESRASTWTLPVSGTPPSDFGDDKESGDPEFGGISRQATLVDAAEFDAHKAVPEREPIWEIMKRRWSGAFSRPDAAPCDLELGKP
ncbi:hypothetical protein EXIGLDRAFT_430100 [Exidia glandulosa HHB12029]|uniref:WW domain-containing protein n=1 Tax=Exidia glandulosa HHB12029 TaxID=1314781 RepID=A0A165BB42_EXIGL|nr:hypothetical protein EXIGLDRAFT_430100 [Exidia glandulosa HHB12029]